ncbi:MAG: CheR family methyltransferase [Sulfuricurvum sp.]|jgi:chemotaxis protein methyltransferase CheR
MISKRAFDKLTTLVKTHSGIHLNESKKQLVVGRLSKRLRQLQLNDYETYYEECISSPEELQTMINTITTNETSFFREAHHFDFMSQTILPAVKNSSFRVWSAASSIGAEGYSIAMELDTALTSKGIEWEVIGTDINTEVVEQGAKGLYPIRFAEQINGSYLKRYCLKGSGSHEGEFLIDDYLRSKVNFLCANLMAPIPSDLGRFDVIFLRNMLIYFDNDSKKKILQNVLKVLKPDGYLFIGHAETIGHINSTVRQIRPTIYKNEQK